MFYDGMTNPRPSPQDLGRRYLVEFEGSSLNRQTLKGKDNPITGFGQRKSDSAVQIQ